MDTRQLRLLLARRQLLHCRLADIRDASRALENERARIYQEIEQLNRLIELEKS